MKHLIFSVRDRAADTYGRPFFDTATGRAVRAFTDEVNREAPDNQLFNHPDDFDLYLIGSFEDDIGLVTAEQPTQLAIGKNVKVRKEE